VYILRFCYGDGVLSYRIEKAAAVAPTMPVVLVPANPVIRSKTFLMSYVQICFLFVSMWSSRRAELRRGTRRRAVPRSGRKIGDDPMTGGVSSS
jgi:hypothetical protein